MPTVPKERRSLLSSQCRVQAPYIEVTIGNYKFGKYDIKGVQKDANGFYTAYKIKYPNYVQSLDIVKINGQVNKYTLTMAYPVTPLDDPNYMEKVFSSVSKTRKIIFSYGDSSMPSYQYKDEEAIITNVGTSFNFGSSGTAGCVINYTVSAVSSALMCKTGNFSFMSRTAKPSDVIKELLNSEHYRLRDIFTGMNSENIPWLIAGDDKVVELNAKTNISPLDYISYLVSCMVPAGSTRNNISKDLYILTIRDDTIYDKDFIDTHFTVGGPYFRVTKTSYESNYSDAYEVDIGWHNVNSKKADTASPLVLDFSVDNNQNYSILYDYQSQLYPDEYTRRINDEGKWEDVYAPVATSKNERYKTNAEDITWFTKLTKYPISGTLKIQGLLRPAMLMQYIRIHIIFPGTKDSEVIGQYNSREHIYSGLYVITSQEDTVSGSGYVTKLKVTKLEGA